MNTELLQEPLEIEGNLFEISLYQSGENLTVKCQGKDGQEVANLFLLALSKTPKKRNQTGLTEFIAAIASVAILFLLTLNTIISPPQSPQINSARNQIGGK